jgi:hypothetical protein
MKLHILAVLEETGHKLPIAIVMRYCNSRLARVLAVVVWYVENCLMHPLTHCQRSISQQGCSNAKSTESGPGPLVSRILSLIPAIFLLPWHLTMDTPSGDEDMKESACSPRLPVPRSRSLKR